MSDIVVRDNLAYGRVDQFLVVVHGDAPPSDEVWEEYLNFTFENKTSNDIVRHLVVTQGASPTAAPASRRKPRRHRDVSRAGIAPSSRRQGPQ